MLNLSRPLKIMHQLLMPRNYFGMLISLVLLILTAPFELSSSAGRVLLSIIVGCILLSCSLAVSPGKHYSWTALFLACLTTLLWAGTSFFDVFPFNSVPFRGFTYVCGLFFLVATLCFIVRDVFSGKVTHNRICGAVCAYLLAGFSFAILYTMIYFVDHSSFLHSDQAIDWSLLSKEDRFSLFSYYSFCTMSTLGLGDIIPGSKITRALSWMQAVLGQMYLTILVARLVGLQISQSEHKRHEHQHEA